MRTRVRISGCRLDGLEPVPVGFHPEEASRGVMLGADQLSGPADRSHAPTATLRLRQRPKRRRRSPSISASIGLTRQTANRREALRPAKACREPISHTKPSQLRRDCGSDQWRLDFSFAIYGDKCVFWHRPVGRFLHDDLLAAMQLAEAGSESLAEDIYGMLRPCVRRLIDPPEIVIPDKGAADVQERPSQCRIHEYG